MTFESESRTYLRNARTAMRGKPSVVGRSVYYVFPDELRKKFHKLLGFEPDFALLPKASLEEGGRRVWNSGDYILFQVRNGIAAVLKGEDGAVRRRRGKLHQESFIFWDTQTRENIFYR